MLALLPILPMGTELWMDKPTAMLSQLRNMVHTCWALKIKWRDRLVKKCLRSLISHLTLRPIHLHQGSIWLWIWELGQLTLQIMKVK
jgi:hypothetical protein